MAGFVTFMFASSFIIRYKEAYAMKVLCVERDIFQLGDMKRTVERIVPDAHVFACRSPSKAAALAEAEGCDILLTGIDMGAARNEGITLAQKVQKLNPRVNIIFVTVCEEWENARELVRLRPSGYVRKPYETQQLAAAFQNLLYAAV